MVASKALARSKLLFKCFYSVDTSVLVRGYVTYVRPLVESATPVWSPCLKKDIQALEQVQRFFTRAVCRRSGIPYNNYLHRLSILGLKSLEYRRVFFDLCMCYQIYYNLIDLAFAEFFTVRTMPRYPITSIKNSCQLEQTVKNSKSLKIRAGFFSIRVVTVWNALPDNVVTAPSLALFKLRLASVNLYQFCVG